MGNVGFTWRGVLVSGSLHHGHRISRHQHGCRRRLNRLRDNGVAWCWLRYHRVGLHRLRGHGVGLDGLNGVLNGRDCAAVIMTGAAVWALARLTRTHPDGSRGVIDWMAKPRRLR